MVQNSSRRPPLKTRPSSGAHASTVQRPSAPCGRPNHRVPSRLPRVAEVLGVDEEADPAEAPLGEQANHHVWPGLRAVRVGFEALAPRCNRPPRRRVPRLLPLPHADDARRCGAASAARPGGHRSPSRAIARRCRRRLRRSRPRARSPSNSMPDVGRGLGAVEQRVVGFALDADGVGHARGEERRRDRGHADLPGQVR